MNHTALVTGGTRGIGRACTLSLLEKGYSVVTTYRQNTQAASELKDLAKGKNLKIIKCDVSNLEQVRACVKEAEQTFGTVDILINNAGIAQQKMFCDISREEWDIMFNTNIGSVYNTVSCVYDSMVRQKWGRIVNISSIWGICGASCEVHYSASKAAVIGFTKALAKELGPSGITVNCIAPGVVSTEMNAHLSDEEVSALCNETPLCRIGTPEEIASAVTYMISDDAGFITGQVLSPNGGIVI